MCDTSSMAPGSATSSRLVVAPPPASRISAATRSASSAPLCHVTTTAAPPARQQLGGQLAEATGAADDERPHTRELAGLHVRAERIDGRLRCRCRPGEGVHRAADRAQRRPSPARSRTAGSARVTCHVERVRLHAAGRRRHRSRRTASAGQGTPCRPVSTGRRAGDHGSPTSTHAAGNAPRPGSGSSATWSAPANPSISSMVRSRADRRGLGRLRPSTATARGAASHHGARATSAAGRPDEDSQMGRRLVGVAHDRGDLLVEEDRLGERRHQPGDRPSPRSRTRHRAPTAPSARRARRAGRTAPGGRRPRRRGAGCGRRSRRRTSPGRRR